MAQNEFFWNNYLIVFEIDQGHLAAEDWLFNGPEIAKLLDDGHISILFCSYTLVLSDDIAWKGLRTVWWNESRRSKHHRKLHDVGLSGWKFQVITFADRSLWACKMIVHFRLSGYSFKLSTISLTDDRSLWTWPIWNKK